jgi:type II restriction/modification system DNA methylase subunit YeeA
MAPTLSPQQFVEKWRRIDLKERSGYQEHFADLCHLVGHPTPAEDDPTGERFAYEAGATKQKGGQGWADVWKKGYFALEYKGKEANLDKAYQQLLQYRESLQNPPLLVVSDMERILIHTNFTNTVKKVYELTYDSLLTPAGFQRLQDMFTNPEAFRVAQTTEQVTQEVARQFARLAENLRKWKHEPADIAHFLIRLLFCLFAEDAALLPSGLFSQLVARTNRNATAFSKQLKQLFGEMATGGWYGNDQIPHFNGRLFDDDRVIDLDSESIDVLVKVSQLDWSSIEPAIFGTLFERSLDPAKRSQLGAHYTSKEDILLIVEPVLMAPLRRKWAEVQAQARELEAQRDQAAPKQQPKITSQMQELITGFAGEIAQVKVLDPACGSGNFLYVALKQLLDLEKEVITFAGNIGLTRPFPQVGPEQLRGIEINEYAHELAQLTVWIGYIQWLRDNGFGRPSEPILKPLDTIKHMDAVLSFNDQGSPYEPVWPEADVIIGNPPFLGGNRIRQELGHQYIDQLFALYEGRVPAFADLVCYWFERTRQKIESNQIQRAGLLSTNSIRGGANRKILDKIKVTGDIFLAWDDRPWILDGAAVRVSMIGFDKGLEPTKYLNGQMVSTINSDLTTSSSDLNQARILTENKGLCFMGASPKGPFDIDADLATSMLAAKGNPNGKSNRDVVRPVVSGIDLVQRNRNKWTIDFGLMSTDEAELYAIPFEYLKRVVYPIRSQNRRASYAQKWWQYAEARPGMRQAIKGKERIIATPEVAKYRIFVWVSSDTLCNQQVLVFPREDDYFFGILHSKPHELWSLQMGTSLGKGNDPRYTPSTTFETFPFPWAPGREPIGDPKVQAIAEAAHELVEKRDNWLNPVGATTDELKKQTLTNLYNQRPTWLDNAHRKLDKAVFAAYDWPENLSDEEILERLLALNLERAKANSGKTALQKDEDD